MPGTEIKVFDKIVRVIDLLATSSQRVTLKKAQQSLGLNKGTAFRILRALELHRLAAKNEDGTFVLGNRVLWWGTCYRQKRDLSKLVRPHLEKLRDLIAETAALSIMMGNQTVVVDQAISPYATSTRFDIGFSAPLHAGATGRVMLAHLDPERRRDLSSRRLERFTERTITDKRRFEQELNKCLTQGFAFSEGERLLGTSSIAAPILGPDKEVLGVISVTGPSVRLTHKRCKSIASTLLKETRLLTQQLNKA
ncbi:MAG: IclR family transcriptional regulator [Deltaproteobacteria bacterium]|nr:IclR family transcriptional regulator [Deltaproteobacteria bacterium]